MLSFIASLFSTSTTLIADFLRSSQTGALVGLGSVFLIFGTVLRRHWPTNEAPTDTEAPPVLSTQTRRETGEAVSPHAMAMQGSVSDSYPTLIWKPKRPLNGYIAGLESVASTTANRSRMNAI